MYSKLGMSVFLILAWAISVHAERMCSDVPWRNCSDPAARFTGTARSSASGDFTSEIERNPALKCAIERARKREDRQEELLKKWEKYGLDGDDVALIMAYTDGECRSKYLFYKELNQDSNQHGLNGGNYPVTKNKLRAALLSMEKAMTFPSQLHRKEPIQFLDKYKTVLKSSETYELTTFTSTSDTQCRFRCDYTFFNVIYQNPSHGANIAEFSYFDEREWLLPAYISGLTVKSINEDKDPAEVIVEGPKQKSCNSAYMFSLGSKDYMLVCFFSSLVMAVFTHPGIISIG